jgi:glycosyltransferase involved in cell wall biosynthesis
MSTSQLEDDVSGLQVGMIGTRFAGLDGVTLESIKVAEILQRQGHRVTWFAGRLDPEFSPGVEVPAAGFESEENIKLGESVFGVTDCPTSVLDEIDRRAASLQTEIEDWAAAAQVDVLMPQNALAIPMQIPLGLAIARFARASGIRVLAHHHDFAWERERFWPNAVGALLEEAFPATGPGVGHLVINSLARDELKARTAANARVLPNVMQFEVPPHPGNADTFRRAAELESGAKVILQPTRMIPRKGIEHTIDLAARLDDPQVVVVITHPEPDEGTQYLQRLMATADEHGVDLRIVAAEPPVGLADAYAAADLVAYPSRIEGFGNALLETLYFRRPLLVNRYDVYVADIAPTGIEAIEMDGELTDDVVARARHWLNQPAAWREAVEHNYDVGLRHFSYETAGKVLAAALDDLR